MGNERAIIDSFFVGDVWLLAGQSNMKGVGDMTAPSLPDPLIRAFSMRREWRLATDPLHVLGESPDACHSGGRQYTPEEGEAHRRTVTKGVGVGVFFAREMMERSKVPQGLICTAHDGTNMEEWSPEHRHFGGTSYYASMLASVRATGQPVAGMLWHQGKAMSAPPTSPAIRSG